MTDYPATYELDADGEATGHVRPYCSAACQRADRPNVPAPNHAEPIGGKDCAADDHFSCCYCGVMIVV